MPGTIAVGQYCTLVLHSLIGPVCTKNICTCSMALAVVSMRILFMHAGQTSTWMPEWGQFVPLTVCKGSLPPRGRKVAACPQNLHKPHVGPHCTQGQKPTEQLCGRQGRQITAQQYYHRKEQGRRCSRPMGVQDINTKPTTQTNQLLNTKACRFTWPRCL